MASSPSIAAYFLSAFVFWVLKRSQLFSMTRRKVSALRAQRSKTGGEIRCTVGMPLLSQTLHHLCACLEAEVLFQSPSFLQAGKHHGEAARDWISGEGCAELSHANVLLAKQHVVSHISWCSGLVCAQNGPKGREQSWLCSLSSKHDWSRLFLLGPRWCSKNYLINTIKGTNITRSTSMEHWPSSIPRNRSPSRSHLGHASVLRLITGGTDYGRG